LATVVLAGLSIASAVAVAGDMRAVAAARSIRGPLVLIDPPYERPDDYHRAADAAAAIVTADPSAVVTIWTPLKDLETFDGFLRRLAAGARAPILAAEARLRPLANPMTMNGCAMVVVNPPDGTEAAASEICGWVAGTLGEAGARAEVWRV
jgi:23S rRNA (adenine2030-N6)-methyltransferase